jgi:type II secretory pathway component PulM
MTTMNPPSDAQPARPATGARLRPLRARWNRLDGRVRLIVIVFGLVLLCGAIQFIFLSARTQLSTQTVAGTPPI